MLKVNISGNNFLFTKKEAKENSVINKIQKLFKNITFLASKKANIEQSFSLRSNRSSNSKIVFIGLKNATNKKISTTVLHEIGHILKPNKHFLLSEQIAWVFAQNVAEKYNLQFDEKYMNDCFAVYKEHYSVFRKLLLNKFKESMPLISVEKLDSLICSAMNNHIKNEYKLKNLK